MLGGHVIKDLSSCLFSFLDSGKGHEIYWDKILCIRLVCLIF